MWWKMKITFKENDQSDKVLIIVGEGTAREDNIIEGWYKQIIEHLSKLKLKK